MSKCHIVENLTEPVEAMLDDQKDSRNQRRDEEDKPIRHLTVPTSSNNSNLQVSVFERLLLAYTGNPL